MGKKSDQKTLLIREAVAASNLRHVAFIMDGNGRWAKKQGKPREYGHKHGTETFKNVIRRCNELGIACVTVYAFSTENWKRPKEEVESIIKLLDRYLDEKYPDGVSVKFIGDMSPLSDKLQKKIVKAEAETAGGESRLNIALNYGSRAEIVNACNRLISQNKTRVTEDDITENLYTSGSPELDLIVRTGGDLRISNFLLWQAAYAEFYFTDTLWPDLSDDDIDRAIMSFCSRKRRFGGLDKEEINK